jgi:hypothetical protein
MSRNRVVLLVLAILAGLFVILAALLFIIYLMVLPAIIS